MKGIIIVDVAQDANREYLNSVIEQDAFPQPLACALKRMMGGIKPMNVPAKFMWPEQKAFPVASPLDAIMNYIYATTQRPRIPEIIFRNMRSEVSDIMDASQEFEPELKSMIMSGSKKVFNRVLADGTKIKVEVETPLERQNKLSKEEGGLEEIVSSIKKTAAKRVDDKIKNLHVDLDKMVWVCRKQAWHNSDLDKLAVALAKEASVTGIKIPYVGNEKIVVGFIQKIAELSGADASDVLASISANRRTDDKVIVDGNLLDKAKFRQYPFNSKENAVKAVGKQVCDILCDDASGNISETKIRSIESASEDNPVLSRIIDQLVPMLQMEDNPDA